MGKDSGRSWEGEGASCLQESPGHPSWVSQQQEQGVLCPGVFPCTQHSTLPFSSFCLFKAGIPRLILIPWWDRVPIT